METELLDVPTVDNTTLAAYVSAEIDVQIATAKKYPRNIKAFKNSAMQLATLDEETAGSMFYVIPRDGKKIEGPSVRMAEIVGSSWGNLRYGARVVSIDDKFVTAQGACHDLETNNAATVEEKRRITNKSGKRFSEDMIQVTAKAACAIALRQAIFKIVPFALVKDIYQAAKLTSIGKATSMQQKRHAAMDWFKKAGADESQVLAFLGKPSLDDIDVDDLVTLRGVVTAIKDGEVTLETALAVKTDDSAKSVRPSSLSGKSQAPDLAPDETMDVNGEIHTAGESSEPATVETPEVAQEQPESYRVCLDILAGKSALSAVDQIEPDAVGQYAAEWGQILTEAFKVACEERRQAIRAGRGPRSNQQATAFETSPSGQEG